MELYHSSKVKAPYKIVHALFGTCHWYFTNFPSDNLGDKDYVQMRKNIAFCQSQVVFELIALTH